TTPDDAKRALIAAAIERARAQKEQVQPRNIDNLTPEQRAEVAEVEARRERIRAMAQTPPEKPV
ncbi:MAG: electron transport complex subunit RsxC, partial [Pseudomonadota bacterium]